MNVLDAIKQRRATKQFDANHHMTETEIRDLMELARLTPTAFNIQHCRFVLVRDEALLKEIRAAAWDQPQITDSSLLVVVCADMKAWKKEPFRYWAKADSKAQDFLLPAIKGYYDGKPQVQRDEALRSCGMAAQTIMLAAKGMGYDTCPMDGFDFDVVGKLINLPKDHLISMFVAVGKRTSEPYPRSNILPYADMVIEDKFD